MTKIAVVTGANQGLGFALAEGLCRTYGPEASIYLTGRDEAKGRAAVATLQSRGMQPIFELLDVTRDQDVARLTEMLQARHGGVDIVISNAAARIVRDRPQPDQVRTFVETNNYGLDRVIRSLGPLLNDGGRFVTVASSFGALKHLPPHLHGLFDGETLTLDDIERVLAHFVDLCEAGEAAAEGWPDWINIPSKVGQVAATRIFAHETRERSERRGLLINAVCPGLIDTAASRPWFSDMSSAATPDEAAIDVLWLATLPDGTREPYGELIQKRRVLNWK